MSAMIFIRLLFHRGSEKSTGARRRLDPGEQEGDSQNIHGSNGGFPAMITTGGNDAA
jgi:hypothetical protein